MTAPICVKCQRFYRPEKNGYWWTEGMPVPEKDGPQHIFPGNDPFYAKYWKPYKVWNGDLWKCEGCGHLTIAGVPRQPVSEHYMPDFKKWHEKSNVQINDCC